LSQAVTARAAHRAFLNRYYGISRHVYDATRKYYLFGRDRLLNELAQEPWSCLVEVGAGTGRNLTRLHSKRPGARFGGIDASDEMVAHARQRCPFASIRFGFAEEFQASNTFGWAPDRILFSYSLSMVSAPLTALRTARASLRPGGSVAVVDFGDFSGFVPSLQGYFRAYLAAFHVNALDHAVLSDASTVTYGPLGYFVIARFPPL